MNDTPAASRPARRPARQAVPAYARYEGTSAWRKDRRRVRAYAWFLAKEERAKEERAKEERAKGGRSEAEGTAGEAAGTATPTP